MQIGRYFGHPILSWHDNIQAFTDNYFVFNQDPIWHDLTFTEFKIFQEFDENSIPSR